MVIYLKNIKHRWNGSLLKAGAWWENLIFEDRKNAQGFNAAKDGIRLLLCSNASGDFMVKLYNPCTLKKVEK